MSKQPILSNYIAGNWIRSDTDNNKQVLNPATNQVLSHVPFSLKSEVNKASLAARKSFKDWRQVPATERIQYLFKLKQLLEDNLDSVAQTITEESGKTIHESKGEMRRAIENVEVACGAPTLMQGYNNEDISSGIDEIMIRQPIGVSAIIAPFNFPAMIPFWFMPYAIAAGNTCIIKPSERVPNTMHQIFELIDQLKLPDGVINLVYSGKLGNMACLFTKDGAMARKFRYEAEAGNIGINIGVAAPMAFFPFSGWRESFFGDLHGQGKDAFRFFTRQKVVVERWPDHWSRKF